MNGSRPSNDPLSASAFARPPALSTRSAQPELYSSPDFTSPTTSGSVFVFPPPTSTSTTVVTTTTTMTTPGTSSMSSAPAPAPAPPAMPPNIDSYLAPTVFHGRPDEDAESWLLAFLKYAAFKNMTAENKAAFLPVLLKSAAADWFDMLGDEDKSTWDRLESKFKERFHDSDLLKWKKATLLWARDQLPSETIDSYFTALQKIAKSAGVADDILRYAMMRGMRKDLRPHVIQSGATTLAELVSAARVAEHAAYDDSSTVDTTMIGQVLNEISASRRAAEKNAADLQRLAARFEASSVASIDRPASPAAARRVTFAAGERSPPAPRYVSPRPPRAVSPGRRQFGRSTQRGQGTRPSSNGYNSYNSNPICNNCGGTHNVGSRYCRAYGVMCYNCRGMNHLARVCRRGRRPNVPVFGNQA